jgi:hypothetical protein
VIEREVARAHQLAGAGLEVRSGDFPGHAVPFHRVAKVRFFACRASVSTIMAG